MIHFFNDKYPSTKSVVNATGSAVDMRRMMVEDGRTLVSEAQRLEPDVIVLDITMPILSGIEAARELDKAGSRAKLVFLTSHTDPAFVCGCFTARGLGYVAKSHLGVDLIPAIHDVLSDHTFVSPSVWQ